MEFSLHRRWSQEWQLCGSQMVVSRAKHSNMLKYRHSDSSVEIGIAHEEAAASVVDNLACQFLITSNADTNGKYECPIHR
jgi:hypothetical protein